MVKKAAVVVGSITVLILLFPTLNFFGTALAIKIALSVGML